MPAKKTTKKPAKRKPPTRKRLEEKKMSHPVTPLTPQQTAAQEAKATNEPYIERDLVAIDKTIATFAGATPDTTISADAGIAAVKDKGFKGFYGRTMSRFLNLFQSDHTADAIAGDDAQAIQAEKAMEQSGEINK